MQSVCSIFIVEKVGSYAFATFACYVIFGLGSRNLLQRKLKHNQPTIAWGFSFKYLSIKHYGWFGVAGWAVLIIHAVLMFVDIQC